ncbi:uncharacterized protein DNG_04713 [Cephalotrichum gorgonifer]|uniref:Uncharacterized protein n=1 Tax=Cephalotrichum gorgonifer TaxID=2041049 RepID=A0AAE8SUT7_9PEZI|nr:uncharacterized protein DNG_04713 [Cephalotrichum gorgonifer]
MAPPDRPELTLLGLPHEVRLQILKESIAVHRPTPTSPSDSRDRVLFRYRNESLYTDRTCIYVEPSDRIKSAQLSLLATNHQVREETLFAIESVQNEPYRIDVMFNERLDAMDRSMRLRWDLMVFHTLWLLRAFSRPGATCQDHVKDVEIIDRARLQGNGSGGGGDGDGDASGASPAVRRESEGPHVWGTIGCLTVDFVEGVPGDIDERNELVYVTTLLALEVGGGSLGRELNELPSPSSILARGLGDSLNWAMLSSFPWELFGYLLVANVGGFNILVNGELCQAYDMTTIFCAKFMAYSEAYSELPYHWRWLSQTAERRKKLGMWAGVTGDEQASAS